jgi:hypothetical protein
MSVMSCNDKGDKTYTTSKALASLEGTVDPLNSEVLERGRTALLSRLKGLNTCLWLFTVVLRIPC